MEQITLSLFHIQMEQTDYWNNYTRTNRLLITKDLRISIRIGKHTRGNQKVIKFFVLEGEPAINAFKSLGKVYWLIQDATIDYTTIKKRAFQG